MLVGRVTKDNADVRRVTVSFVDWLDANEVVQSFTTPVIAIEQQQVFQNGMWTTTPSPTPTDTTPLTVSSSGIVSVTCDDVTTGAAGVVLFLNAGTVGLTYKVTFTVTGSTSGRTKQVDVLVVVREPV